MVNYEVTTYTSVKALIEAIEAIDNTVNIKVVTLIEDGKPKYLLIK